MKRVLIIPFVFLIFAFNCKKKTKPHEPDPVIPVEKQDSIYFVFVNKIGFRKDSVYLGNGENRVFVGVILKTGYYNVKTNKSDIFDKVYNRDNTDPSSRLKDSIVQIAYPLYINSQYNFIVTLIWQKWHGTAADEVRALKFQTNTAGNDTIKEKGNKIIKFTWPDDTASGKFTKTYDGP